MDNNEILRRARMTAYLEIAGRQRSTLNEGGKKCQILMASYKNLQEWANLKNNELLKLRNGSKYII